MIAFLLEFGKLLYFETSVGLLLVIVRSILFSHSIMIIIELDNFLLASSTMCTELLDDKSEKPFK